MNFGSQIEIHRSGTVTIRRLVGAKHMPIPVARFPSANVRLEIERKGCSPLLLQLLFLLPADL